MQWLLALGKLAAGWLVVWLLYKAIVDPIIVDRIQRLVGRDRGRKRRIQRQMRTQRLVLLLSSERGRRRRRMVRLAALHLAMLGWTWVVAWAWDTVPYEGILDLFVYYISRVCAASIISSSIISLLETLVTMAKVPTLLATSSSSGAGERDQARALLPPFLVPESVASIFSSLLLDRNYWHWLHGLLC